MDNTAFQQLLVALTFAVTVILWLRERVPIAFTSLFCPALLVVAGILTPKDYLFSFLDPVILLLLGSFVIARSLSFTGLDKRLAYGILKIPWTTRTPYRLLATLAFISCSTSLIMSNSAVTAMLLPVTLTIIETLKLPQEHKKYEIALLLMLSWGASVAVGILVGTPPNLIAESFLAKNEQLQIGFLKWTIFAMPINFIAVIAAWATVCFLYARGVKFSLNISDNLHSVLPKLSALTSKERYALYVISLVSLLWVLPDSLAITFGTKSQLAEAATYWLSPSNVALFGAAILFLFPTKLNSWQPLLPLKVIPQLEWKILALFGGGIALGRATFQSGLATNLGSACVSYFSVDSTLEVTALATGLGVVLSELTSNTAAASMLVPLAAGMAHSLNLTAVAPVLGAALGTSFGFMMPISTPPNSIVYSSGRISLWEMAKAGFILDIFGFVIVLTCLKYILPILGWWG